MKILLKRRSIVIASTALLLALITVVSMTVFSSGGPITGIVNVISSPLRELASSIAGTFEGIYASIYRYRDLMERYEQALTTIAEFERNYQESIDLAEENERLRSLLGFRTRHPDYTSEPAMVINWGSSNWSSTFTINRGYSNSNIQAGNGVVTEYGMLIGQVTHVEATTATVITVLDTTFSVSGTVGEGGGIGTLRGDFAYMRSGLLVLDLFEDDMVVMVGDSVVTSGLGGVFPPLLVVGEVTEVLRHSTGIGRYATIEPIREISTISQVFVITEFRDLESDLE